MCKHRHGDHDECHQCGYAVCTACEILVCRRCHQEKGSAFCRHCGFGTATWRYCKVCGPAQIADAAEWINNLRVSNAALGKPAWPPRQSVIEKEMHATT